jgi:hypothetical protein
MIKLSFCSHRDPAQSSRTLVDNAADLSTGTKFEPPQLGEGMKLLSTGIPQPGGGIDGTENSRSLDMIRNIFGPQLGENNQEFPKNLIGKI